MSDQSLVRQGDLENQRHDLRDGRSARRAKIVNDDRSAAGQLGGFAQVWSGSQYRRQIGRDAIARAPTTWGMKQQFLVFLVNAAVALSPPTGSTEIDVRLLR